MLTEQEQRLAENLALGMPNAKALEAAGYNIKTRGYASIVVRRHMLNPQFLAHLEECKLRTTETQALDLLDVSGAGFRTYVVTKYRELLEKTLNDRDKDKSGKPLTYNPNAARQALRDLAEMACLFEKLPTPNTPFDLGGITANIEAAEKRLKELRVVEGVSEIENDTTP